MKRLVFCVCILALVTAGPIRAQEDDWAEDDLQAEYEAYFGASQTPREPGPSSIAEAKKQGRGYRIGKKGVHSAAEAESLGEVHVVQDGDTLWQITDNYFEDPWKWPQVWAWNPEITNPHWIYPLDNIRLSQQTLDADRNLTAQEDAGQIPSTKAGVHRIGMEQTGPQVARRKMPVGTVFLRDQGYLDRDALVRSGHIIGGNEEHMFLSASDHVYIRLGEKQAVKAGDDLTIFRRIKPEERPPEGKGELVRIMGTVRVRSYDPDKRLARADIIESLDPIERGFNVTQMERAFDLVQPQKATANVIARIIATVQPRDMISYGNVVFLDVGEGQGIAPGNRFFIVRREDNWQKTLERSPEEMGNIVPVPALDHDGLPKEVIAELRVIKVRKDTTIALVVRSDFDIAHGEIAEMREGL